MIIGVCEEMNGNHDDDANDTYNLRQTGFSLHAATEGLYSKSKVVGVTVLFFATRGLHLLRQAAERL